MRKVLYYFMTLIFLTLLLNGCSWASKYQPIEQENTRWTCKELDIYFDVSDKFKDVTWCNTYGQINLNGEITEIRVTFGYGTNATFYPISACVTKTAEDGTIQRYIDGSTRLFIGRCNFSKNKCVVTIISNEKGFLDDSVKTLTFIKGEIPEGAPSPEIPEPSPTPEPEIPPVVGRSLRAAERDNAQQLRGSYAGAA